jgi:hypothetical protein
MVTNFCKGAKLIKGEGAIFLTNGVQCLDHYFKKKVKVKKSKVGSIPQ